VIDWGGGVFASCCRGSNCTLARAMDGRISAAAPLPFASQLPLPIIVKLGWSGFPVYDALDKNPCMALALAFAVGLSSMRNQEVRGQTPTSQTYVGSLDNQNPKIEYQYNEEVDESSTSNSHYECRISLRKA